MQPEQPDSDKQTWQQPTEQLSQAPYASPPTETAPVAPVVSLTPEEPVVQAPQPSVVSVSSTPVAQQENTEQPSSLEEAPEEAPATPTQPEEEPVHWQAHEYIHHDKSPLWFIVFTVAVIILIAAAIFLIQSVTFAVLVPVMAVALLVYSHRPPRILNYTLSQQGLHINDRLYPFAQFKGFGVIHDGDEYSVMLIPIKRFQPGVSVYFPEEAGEAIVDMLGARLPMQELHLDAVDKIIRKLRI